jgi:hemerythrin-like domain-containing protein
VSHRLRQEEIALLLGSFTATSSLRKVICDLRNLIGQIEPDARDAKSVSSAAKATFQQNFSGQDVHNKKKPYFLFARLLDVFFPSQELEALAQTIEHHVLRDSRQFLTASQLFMSTSGVVDNDECE